MCLNLTIPVHSLSRWGEWTVSWFFSVAIPNCWICFLLACARCLFKRMKSVRMLVAWDDNEDMPLLDSYDDSLHWHHPQCYVFVRFSSNARALNTFILGRHHFWKGFFCCALQCHAINRARLCRSPLGTGFTGITNLVSINTRDESRGTWWYNNSVLPHYLFVERNQP